LEAHVMRILTMMLTLMMAVIVTIAGSVMCVGIVRLLLRLALGMGMAVLTRGGWRRWRGPPSGQERTDCHMFLLPQSFGIGTGLRILMLIFLCVRICLYVGSLWPIFQRVRIFVCKGVLVFEVLSYLLGVGLRIILIGLVWLFLRVVLFFLSLVRISLVIMHCRCSY